MNIDKTGNAIIYFIKQANKPLDVYHIAKLLYFLDSRFYMLYERTVTELEYACLPNGPAPDNYEGQFSKLMKLEFIEARLVENKSYVEYVGLKEPDLTTFSFEEFEILKGVAETYTNMSFKELYDITHEEKPYCLEKYKMGEIFDFKDLRDTEEEFLSAINESLSDENIVRFNSTEELLHSLGL